MSAHDELDHYRSDRALGYRSWDSYRRRRPRTAGAAVVLTLSAGLLLAGPAAAPGLADDTGLTDSAVTVAWNDGTRDPDDPMYEDFKDLEVTVSQTRNLVNQGVRITWRGARPTVPGDRGVPNPPTKFGSHFLQIMQCWGDESGPTPQQCHFGSQNDPGGIDAFALWRLSSTRSTTPRDPLGSVDGSFRTRDGQLLPYEETRVFLNRNTTNEIPAAYTGPDGTGAIVFETLTSVDAPHMGCGQPVRGNDGTVTGESCWLVIVPRGSHHVDGSKAPYQTDTPFSPSYWRNRIQVRLDFDPVTNACPIGAEERLTLGSELAGAAMLSWQRKLCGDNGTVYGYSSVGDPEARRILASDTSPVGLAFTHRPVTGDPDIVHAPVAVSALTVAFHLEANRGERAGSVIRELRLTPRLLAKILTYSYQDTVPGGVWGSPDAQHVADAPRSLYADPEFQQVNPELVGLFNPNGSWPLLVVQGQSDAAWAVWEWIRADEEARAWLGGEPDEWGMTVNPHYADLDLDANGAQSFPQADLTSYQRPPAEYPYDVTSLRPQVGSLATAARMALTGDTGQRTTWDGQRQPPGYVSAERQLIGNRLILSLTDTVSAERYGLFQAALRNRAGEFVAPGVESMAAAVAAMEPGAAPGTLAFAPAVESPDAYPLTLVVHAAVDTAGDGDPAALGEYAHLLAYAADRGQDPGQAPGQLRPGYLPLPEELRETTRCVAEHLPGKDVARHCYGASGGGVQDPPAPSGAGTPGGGSAVPVAGDGTDGGIVPVSGPAADGTRGGGAAGTADPDGDGDDPAPSPPPSPQQVATVATPATSLGWTRWALVAAGLLGLLGLLAGPVLLRFGPRRTEL